MLPTVYILTNRKKGTLYIGVTSNLPRRLYEHRNGLVKGFTNRYNLHRLVWYETGSSMVGAIAREKQLKGWLRKRKIELIEQKNPGWEDLGDNLF